MHGSSPLQAHDLVAIAIAIHMWSCAWYLQKELFSGLKTTPFGVTTTIPILYSYMHAAELTKIQFSH